MKKEFKWDLFPNICFIIFIILYCIRLYVLDEVLKSVSAETKFISIAILSLCLSFLLTYFISKKSK